MLLGTIVNVVAVILGSLIGVLCTGIGRKKEMSERGKRVSDAIFTALGLSVMLIGIVGAIKGAVNGQIKDAFVEGSVEFAEISTQRTLAIILSMVVGVIIGELIDLDKQINKLGDKLQKLLSGKGGNVSEAFVSASLLFCVGSMTIVGAMESGISRDHTLLVTKSVMDFVASIIFASTMGIGVAFSAIFVLIYQGGITLIASELGHFLSNDVITCMGSVGSLLIIVLGFNLVCKTKIKIMNFIPAMFLPIAFIPLLNLLM